MFFLGIAGPLMPYFLMTGILIAFTLEVSAEKMRKPGKVAPDHHCLCVTAKPGISDEFNYYICSQPDQTTQRDQADGRNPSLYCFQPPGMKNERKFAFNNDSLPSDKYIGRYFGLSPPCKFVS